ncbi:MAG: ATP-binding protein [Pseudomonadota bacterium]
MEFRASLSFLRLLANLRWLAVAGQALTVLIVTHGMGIALPQMPLWWGVAALAVFNLFATWYARSRQDAGHGVVFAHMFVDIVSLTWMVGWSGGIENPFSSLFLLPIAMSILALPARWALACSAASLAGYALTLLAGHELPHVHGLMGDTFSLHKVGMLVNFAVSALVVLVFFTRVAAARRDSEREVAQLREQFARDEGILALATHAASVAHELNTPLGTLTLMVEDLAAQAESEEQREEFATLKALLEVCRDRVRELAAPAEAGATGGRAADVDLERVIERWLLVRPTVQLRRSGSIAGLQKADPAVGYLLQALLNNAADAGQQAGNTTIDLHLEADDGLSLRASIRDYGKGFDPAQVQLPGRLFRTSKANGLGIGLVLSHATVERLGGELSVRSATEGSGAVVSFFLPALVKA